MVNRMMLQRVLSWSRRSRHSLQCFSTTAIGTEAGNKVIVRSIEIVVERETRKWS